ncbi:alpha/beta hydrolase [Zavarzinia aquatilis]|uniref:AB hydrolase-1 domain-containing protein n=1 Tax=Zavarzinia aquatilis TaxID=2211142 RepID=A0A317E8C3_9PROT|nr:alpha/beta hydrolase [Zavarzinia aquatilis]PWR22782.1 hypothetical protein DKG74_10135 [Zavarzinia aquatilis]
MRRLAVLFLIVAAAVPVGVGGVLPALLMSRFRSEVPPLPADIPAARVSFRSADGVDLVAWAAEAEEPKATVILVHGASGTRGDAYVGLYGMMRDLLGRNYSVLALDLRNHGESGAGPRGPSFGPDEARDVIAAADWIKSRSAGRRIAAYGISMGGNAVLYAAAADPRIEALITQDTYTVAPPVMRRGLIASTGLPEFVADAVLWSARHFWGLADEAGRGIEVTGSLGARPWLVIQSAADPIVPAGEGEALAAADPAARLWLTPAPAADDPLLLEAGAWGSHARDYLLAREAWVDRVADFLDGQFAVMFG